MTRASVRRFLGKARAFRKNQQEARERERFAAALAHDSADAVKQRASEYADRVIGNPNPCLHGHINCADRPGGDCVDEVFANAGL